MKIKSRTYRKGHRNTGCKSTIVIIAIGTMFVVKSEKEVARLFMTNSKGRQI